MNQVYLLIGSNRSDRTKNLRKAREQIIQNIGLIKKSSAIYETEPWGFQDDNLFLNQCLLVNTSTLPHDLLIVIKEIEKRFKRIKSSGIYENREMDIDILFYNNIILHDRDLKIPHPLLHERRFVLVPMVEIEPDLVHPVFKQTVRELLIQCSDQKSVKPYL